MKSNVGSVLVHVVLPLVIGALIYVAWRADEARLVTWLPRGLVHGLSHSLGAIPLPRLVIESGSDAAWGWSFGAAIALVWRDRPTRSRWVWLILGGVVAAYAEIGQLWQYPPGTFDIVDLLAIVIAYVVSASLISARPQ